MIKLVVITFLTTLAFTSKTIAQEHIKIEGSLDSRLFLSENRLPFWMFTNSQGFVDQTSDFGVSAFAKANYKLSENQFFQVGLGAYFSDGFEDNLRRSDLYIEYQNKWFSITAGARRKEITRSGLSTINANILDTGNARPLPGVLLTTSNPINIFSKLSLNAEIAHYNLNDERRTEGARIHYKMLELNWQFDTKSSLSLCLRHYVQWGGKTEDGIELPDNFNAFLRVFRGANGGDIDNPNEAINALGNHLGSYQIEYKKDLNRGTISLYHQTLFEDRSGRELNNFPDGVWGVNYSPKKNSFIKEILYEYIQTVSQSGRPRSTAGLNQQSGGDNYFRNGIYPSGWTYDGAIIGLPLINPLGNLTTPINNRMIGHHMGVAGSILALAYKVKVTYIKNFGSYSRPIEPKQKGVYGYGELGYATEKYGVFTLYGGADYLNNLSNAASIGVGYRVVIN